MTLGEAIKSIRESRGLTQAQLGAKILAGKHALAHMENGHVYLKEYQIKDIAKALEVPISLIYLMAIDPTDFNTTAFQVNKLKLAAMTEFNVTFGGSGNVVVGGVTMRRFRGSQKHEQKDKE